MARLTSLLGAVADHNVSVGGREQTLERWLSRDREITRLTRPFVEQHAARSGSAGLKSLLTPERSAEFRALLRGLQVVDLLKEYPAAWTATELVTTLRPLTPRLYSIASSRRVAGDEVHLTVAVVDTPRGGEPRPGATSGYLAEVGTEGEGARFPRTQSAAPAAGRCGSGHHHDRAWHRGRAVSAKRS